MFPAQPNRSLIDGLLVLQQLTAARLIESTNPQGT
jgi:hypothetical protein